jgi:hypothetical protein
MSQEKLVFWVDIITAELVFNPSTVGRIISNSMSVGIELVEDVIAPQIQGDSEVAASQQFLDKSCVGEN